MTVGVLVEDPGGSLGGNYPQEAVQVPSSVAFAAGDAEMTVEITPPDDWRDKTDSVLTFTVQQEPHYEISGAASIDVTVLDNDTAPQVAISFSQEEVEEGTTLILWVTRTGQDTNPLEVPVTVGPVGEQMHVVFGLDPGVSQRRLTYLSVDDDYKGPDIHYEATLHPLDEEFWVPAGNATVNASVLDNDLYTVGIERIRINWDEGRPLRFRIFHDGHTGEEVPVNLLIEEIGNAVDDDLLGERPARILRGSNTLTPVIYTEANDGSDGDAIFTVRLQPGRRIRGGPGQRHSGHDRQGPGPPAGDAGSGTTGSTSPRPPGPARRIGRAGERPAGAPAGVGGLRDSGLRCRQRRGGLHRRLRQAEPSSRGRPARPFRDRDTPGPAGGGRRAVLRLPQGAHLRRPGGWTGEHCWLWRPSSTTSPPSPWRRPRRP